MFNFETSGRLSFAALQMLLPGVSNFFIIAFTKPVSSQRPLADISSSNYHFPRRSIKPPMSPPSDAISLNSSIPSGLPPSYSQHQQDELLSMPTPSSLSRRRRRQASVARTPTHPSVNQLLQVLGTNDALDLTIDNGLIYPPPPSNALYHLPRLLTWSGNEIFLFRSLPALMSRRGHSTSPARDLALYTMRRTPFTHEVTLLPRREGLKTAVMRGKKRMFRSSMSWEVEVKGQVILKYAKGKWIDKDGNIVATEKTQVAAGTAKNALNSYASREAMTISGEGLDIATKDLIVAAWCTRIWRSHGKVSLARTLMNGEGMIACILHSNQSKLM